MNNKQKLLVLGSNFGSVEIVQRAKERGIYTIVTDYYDVSKSNAKQYCDECWDISITETEFLARKCRDSGITAVTCGVSEFSSEMVFKLCDVLGLPYYCTWDSWSYARNKRKFKDVCRKNNVPVADDYYITDVNDAEQTKMIKYPVVVKPIDCGGNAGVTFCNNIHELKKAFVKAQEVSDNKDTIICEKKLIGKEYAAAYALADGEASLINFFAMHSQNGEPTNCYSVDVTTTGMLNRFLFEIDKNIKRVFKQCGFREGFVWVEVMSDQDGHLYVLETGYRFPGGMLPQTYSAVCNFNAIDWYLDCFLGIKHLPEDLPKPQEYEYQTYGVSYMLWNREGGIIKEVLGIEEISNHFKENGFIIDFIRHPGYELHPYSLMGEVIFTANDRESVKQIIEYINMTVKVINENDTNVLIQFTNYNKIF